MERFHLTSSPFSITLNLLSVADTSESESVVKSLVETFDDEEDGFLFLFHPERFFLLLFLSTSSESELEDVLCLLFLDFLFCLSTFLFGEGFATFALPTIFSAGSSGESPALPIWFPYRENKAWLRMVFLFKIIIWITLEALLKLSSHINFPRILAARAFASLTKYKVERGWWIELHIGMSQSSLRNADFMK